MEIILASASPRRVELLTQMGLTFQVVPSLEAEGRPLYPWQDWVQDLAVRKAQAIAPDLGDVVLAADTLVIMGRKVLGKPKDDQETREMLRLLSGRSHQVMTGVCVLHRALGRVYRDVEVTKVFFRSLSDAEIETYVASGEGLDKAGAYGIQGLGGLLVEKIKGCYYNVVGLPLVKTMQMMRRCGVVILGE